MLFILKLQTCTTWSCMDSNTYAKLHVWQMFDLEMLCPLQNLQR